jgi:hypothetical protein
MNEFAAESVHIIGAVNGFYPDAPHLRNYFAVSIGAYAATWPITQVLRASHGAGHARRVEDTLATHAAVEDDPLGQFFSRSQPSFRPAVSETNQDGI